MKHSLPLAQFSAIGRRLAGPVTHMRCSARSQGAFTLIELLIVVAIMAILAGLTLGTLGYVNKKGATSRAQAEVAALSSAIERYKLDTGTYPTNSAALFSNLCSGSRVYFEPAPSMLGTNGRTVQFVDPWSAPYEYANYTNYFELWSTAGGTASNNWIRN